MMVAHADTDGSRYRSTEFVRRKAAGNHDGFAHDGRPILDNNLNPLRSLAPLPLRTS